MIRIVYLANKLIKLNQTIIKIFLEKKKVDLIYNHHHRRIITIYIIIMNSNVIYFNVYFDFNWTFRF